jgi:hypothetical protein
MEATASTKSATAERVRPFTVDIPDEQMDDLRSRIEATRLPSKETVEDASQGVQLATTQELLRYWESRRAAAAAAGALRRRDASRIQITAMTPPGRANNR